ncbi:MAG: HAMP domain-containing protein, partial [Deltaproteobacteria bacterium]|nr:HAMP domain-containing protein [Deltaproteobacteria bacterium]
MTNVNKLFRRLTIRTKLVIAFALLGIVPLLVVGGYGAFYSFSLHVILLVGGLVLVIAITVGIIAASHFTKPILELSRGAEIVAAGNFNHSIKAETNDEIEDLAHTFNLMTDKLKKHEGQLRDAHERLEMKAREAAALYRLGTEISAFLDLDKILDLVANRAQELLGADVAALGLLTEDGHGFSVGATSGPAEAFSFGSGQTIPGFPECIGCCTVSKENGGPKNSTFACRVINGDYLKAQLAVPLKTRDKVIGALCVGNR